MDSYDWLQISLQELSQMQTHVSDTSVVLSMDNNRSRTWTASLLRSRPSMKTLPTAAAQKLSPGTRPRWCCGRSVLNERRTHVKYSRPWPKAKDGAPETCWGLLGGVMRHAYICHINSRILKRISLFHTSVYRKAKGLKRKLRPAQAPKNYATTTLW